MGSQTPILIDKIFKRLFFLHSSGILLQKNAVITIRHSWVRFLQRLYADFQNLFFGGQIFLVFFNTGIMVGP